jgi:hypothetical protein
MLKHFRDEFVHHIEHKACVAGTNGTDGAPALTPTLSSSVAKEEREKIA